MRQEFVDQFDPEELQNGYFQHDAATAHRADTSLNDRLAPTQTNYFQTMSGYN